MPRPTGPAFKLLLAVLLLAVLACDASSLNPFAARPGGAPVPTLSNVLPPPPTGAAPVAARPSPAGWIAFVKDGDLWLIHPDGSALKQITKYAPASSDPAAAPPEFQIHWSPDGRLLAFSRLGAILVLDISSLATTQIVSDTAGGFDWSADTKNILYDAALSDPKAA
ncbi:MAG: TolB family protein, partial [Rhodospirillaceae bacterium]